MATFDAAAVLEQTKIVWPSGLALAATSAAMAPLAPGLFSTPAGRPQTGVTPSAHLLAPLAGGRGEGRRRRREEEGTTIHCEKTRHWSGAPQRRPIDATSRAWASPAVL